MHVPTRMFRFAACWCSPVVVMWYWFSPCSMWCFPYCHMWKNVAELRVGYSFRSRLYSESTVRSWCWRTSKSALLLCRPFVTCSDESEWVHVADKSASPLSCCCADHCQPSHTLSFIKWVSLLLCFMEWDTLSFFGYILCLYIVIVFYYK